MSAYNKGQSEGVRKIERLGKLENGKITLFGTNKEAENTLLSTLNAVFLWLHCTLIVLIIKKRRLLKLR